jgi:hypothetical protein
LFVAVEIDHAVSAQDILDFIINYDSSTEWAENEADDGE